MHDNNTVVYIDSDLEELIPIYLNNRHKDIEDISRLLTEEELWEIQRLGHSMKGSGSGYGFDEITVIGKGIEEAAKAGDKNRISELIDDLRRYVDTINIVFEDDID